MYQLIIEYGRDNGFYTKPTIQTFETLKGVKAFIIEGLLTGNLYYQCGGRKFNPSLSKFDFKIKLFELLPQDSDKLNEFLLKSLRDKDEKYKEENEKARLKIISDKEASEKALYEKLKLKYDSE